ncbi:hypothetical protein Tco_0991140 [Tanacetum coccineum]|uniref:Uncharacterized protein n=1 Tax=Tanacetum coccineum TaxID=301880 RepID=A0ABQ5EYF3_9ASTR
MVPKRTSFVHDTIDHRQPGVRSRLVHLAFFYPPEGFFAVLTSVYHPVSSSSTTSRISFQFMDFSFNSSTSTYLLRCAKLVDAILLRASAFLFSLRGICLIENLVKLVASGFYLVQYLYTHLLWHHGTAIILVPALEAVYTGNEPVSVNNVPRLGHQVYDLTSSPFPERSFIQGFEKRALQRHITTAADFEQNPGDKLLIFPLATVNTSLIISERQLRTASAIIRNSSQPFWCILSRLRNIPSRFRSKASGPGPNGLSTASDKEIGGWEPSDPYTLCEFL